MLIHHFLSQSARNNPEKIAVIEPGRSIRYDALEDRANRVAHGLIDRGVRAGDRVLLALENSVDWIASYFGILKAGAVVVPLPADSRNNRLPEAVRDCAPSACVVERTTLPAVQAALGPIRIPILVRSKGSQEVLDHSAGLTGLEPAVAASAAHDPAVTRVGNDLAAIIYTSGSTGRPRGVMLSHSNIAANTASIVEYLDLAATDRVMVVLPLHYVYGLSLLHTHIFVAGSVVLDNRFVFPNVVLQAMQTHAVTGFAGVPSTFAILLHRSTLARVRVPTLRYVTQAGGPMPQVLIREWHAAMPDVPLILMYGATEASARLSYLDPAELPRRAGSIGKAIPNVELHVVRDDGSLASPGEVGELAARGPNIMLGYWNRPEETRAAFGPFGYRTGDLVREDADGFFYIVGRKQDMLKIGAHRVGAPEIEDVLHEHPAVDQATVVGAPDDVLGEVAVAFTVARENSAIDPNELVRFCRARLPDYKVPSRVLVVPELPRNEAGKIDKHALRRILNTDSEPRLTRS